MDGIEPNAFQAAALALVETYRKVSEDDAERERLLGPDAYRSAYRSLTLDGGRGAGHTVLVDLLVQRATGKLAVIDAYSIRTASQLRTALERLHEEWKAASLEMVVVDGAHMLSGDARDSVRSWLDAGLYLFLG